MFKVGTNDYFSVLINLLIIVFLIVFCEISRQLQTVICVFIILSIKKPKGFQCAENSDS